MNGEKGCWLQSAIMKTDSGGGGRGQRRPKRRVATTGGRTGRDTIIVVALEHQLGVERAAAAEARAAQPSAALARRLDELEQRIAGASAGAKRPRLEDALPVAAEESFFARIDALSDSSSKWHPARPQPPTPPPRA